MKYINVEHEIYEKSTTCRICEKPFINGSKDIKVRDHCHYTGKYRGAAHQLCNFKFKEPKNKAIPVIFHNLSGYDSHLFIKKLSVIEGKLSCIPSNDEKYVSFTKTVKVGKFTNQ
jgi:Recombination endonuclease VII